MGFQFSETMAGTIEWQAEPGVRHPFRFDVTASAESTLGHLRDGKATLHGLVHAPPRADGVPADGVITIRPVGKRVIAYELHFTGDDGVDYQLVGEKTIRWLQARESFTRLPAEVLDGAGRKVATVETRFDLQRDLWTFLRSFKRV